VETGVEEVTELLKAWGGGDKAALDRLIPLVYAELHRMAQIHMRNQPAENALQTTALVHEAYLRLIDVKNIDWKHRTQFFAISAQVMRRILVDAARARGARKRGAGANNLTLDDVAVLSPEPEESIVALDAALEEFAKVAPRQAKVVEMRYFGGLNEQEIAAIMGTSTRTIERDWEFARSWLLRELKR
jgi:RNA polymerase sigma factor (TIGR02999 family)